MRKFFLFLLVLLVIAGGIAAYLFATTPKTSAGVKFPLSADHRAFLGRVPASAESFAFVPRAAVLHGKLLANRVTRVPLEEWARENPLPRPWMIGGADLLIWRSGKTTRYLVRLDPLRAALVRFYLLFNAGVEEEGGSRFLINATSEPPIAGADLDGILALTAGLPAGDALIVQRDRSRGAFPPIGRPAVTSAQVTAQAIDLTSRSTTNEEPRRQITDQLPVSAILSGAFTKAPRISGDLDRLFGGDVSKVIENGGSLVIYSVKTGTWIPRPKGLVAVKAGEDTRGAMGDFIRVADMVGESRDTGDQILVSLDDESMGLYLKDAKTPVPWPANGWILRFRPAALLPVLNSVADNVGLQVGMSRIHRSARDLRRWVRYFEKAELIEAAQSVEGGAEVLRVRVAAARE
jgi:hypothetical protein